MHFFSRVLMASILSCILLLWLHHVPGFVAGDKDYLGDVAVNCGSVGKSGAFDGREWVGDAGSELVSWLQLRGKSKSSTAAGKSFSSDPVPYKTSRISTTPFHYKFRVTPGQKFVRLHFHSAHFHGFKSSVDIFTVKAGPFTLLHNFSASLAADALGVNSIVKEFCLNIEKNAELLITFSPSTTSTFRNVVAFVNGIEIVSMPTGLYYTKDSDSGAHIVGLHNRFAVIDNSTALELIERLNIGASTVSSVEDLGLYRRWNGDSDFLMESRVSQAIHPTDRIMYPSIHSYPAPPKVYQTSWQMKPTASVQGLYTLRWKIAVDVGFGYFARLHFCDFEPGVTNGGKTELAVLMNGQVAETNSINKSGHGGSPFYRDYMVMMKGEKGGGKCDLSIAISSSDHLAVGLLNGLEIFKLSNLENSLATPNLVSPRRMSSSWKLKLFTLVLRNSVTAGITFLLVLLNVIVWGLSQTCEASTLKEKDTRLLSIDPFFRCFSLYEIQAATHDFSDAAVIGRGGFGRVYKGFITAISQVAAIKRLKADSKQGAREFWTEVETLSKFRHTHLVSLIGYCNESSEMILVYEYMPRGTLADNIYKFAKDGKDNVLLSWEQRLRICIGAARGLEYLHIGAIHRDVKDTNILLDENFVAKVSDFGLSKLEKFSESKSYISTKVWGTPYYIDPEYQRTRKLTQMVDVYAFGVVLLVVVSGRPAGEALLSCFMECVAKRDFVTIVDPNLGWSISLKEFVKCIESCLDHQPKKRPTMAQVAARLELALEKQAWTCFPETEDAVEMSHIYEDRSVNSVQFSQTPSPPPLIEETVQPPPTNAKEANSSSSVRKPGWGMSWITTRSSGKPKKETDMVSSYESNPHLISEKKSGRFIGERRGPRFSRHDLLTVANYYEVDGSRGSLTVYASGREVWSGYSKELRKRVTVYEDGCLGIDSSKVDLEMKKLYQLRHINLHSLIGYCLNEPSNQSFTIYEHVGFESLHSRIYNSGKYAVLSWKRRLSICIGVAEGLAYLQRCTGRATNYGSLRLENILLDGNGIPKISHFGLSGFNFLGKAQVKVRRSILHGFEMREDSDLFSFGLLLVEVLLSRRINLEEFADFLVAMQKSINSRTFHLAFDSTLKGGIATECLSEYLKAIFSSTVVCKLPTSMAGVASILKFALKLQEKAEAAKEADGSDSAFRIEDIYQNIFNLDNFINSFEFKLM